MGLMGLMGFDGLDRGKICRTTSGLKACAGVY